MLVEVQSKLRLALGSVKDHASIGKAMIYSHDSYSSIEIAVVRATSHENTPIHDKYMHEILFLVSNSPGSIPFLAERISNRLHKTRNHIVALKTLVLIHRLLRGGDRYFEKDLRHTYISGHLQLKIRWFLKNSGGNSGSFLNNYVAFLEERMGWAINQAGKLEPIVVHGALKSRFYEEKFIEIVFRRLPKCQVFLDRVLDFSPAAFEISSSDRLTQAAMSNILRESFQVYTNLCEDIATLFDSFFDFNEHTRVLAFELLKRASQQSYELFDFFENCKIVIGRKNLEYPVVQIITEDHVLAMEQFLSTAKNDDSCSCPNLSDLKMPVMSNFKEETRKEQTLFSLKLETKISKVWVVFD